MIVEKLRFALQRVAHAFFGVDVLLTAIDDTDEAQLQWIYTSSEDIQCICTCIHEVELSEYTNCAPALWIDGTGKLKRVWVGQVNICRWYGKNDTLEDVYLKEHERKTITNLLGFEI